MVTHDTRRSARSSGDYQLLVPLLVASRERSELSQVELATRLKKPQSWVSKVERGERRIDPVELIRWCDEVGADLVDMLEKLRGSLNDGAATLVARRKQKPR